MCLKTPQPATPKIEMPAPTAAPAPPPQAFTARAPDAPVLNEATVKGNGEKYSTRRGRKSMIIPRNNSIATGGANSGTGVNVPS